MKENGCYYTPLPLIDTHLKTLKIEKGMKILEPSCGDGRYVRLLKDYNVDCIEKYPIEKTPKCIHDDFLSFKSKPIYDLIIGNPPYHKIYYKDVIKYDKNYTMFYSNTCNMYLLFIIAGIRILKKDGILSYILPQNFLNTQSYNNLRKYINDFYTVLNIQPTNTKFKECKVKTIIFTIQKTMKKNNIYTIATPIIQKKKNIINILFQTEENVIRYKELIKNKKSLKQHGFTAVNGTGQSSDGTNILLKPSNIYLGKVREKPLFKSNQESAIPPYIVVSRGFGHCPFVLNPCLITDKEYVVDGHLICIKHQDKSKLKELHTFLSSKECKELVFIICQNNQLTTGELLFLFYY